MFRNGFTGSYSYYNVCVKRDDGSWDVVGPNTAFVPRELRRRRQEPSHYYESLEPWASLSASGEIWQKYGSNGWATDEPANVALAQLKEHAPTMVFCITKTTLSREVEIIVPELEWTGC